MVFYITCNDISLIYATAHKHTFVYEPGPSEKGVYGFSNIMRANDVDDVIYDVTIGNIQHANSDASLKYCNILFSKLLAQNQ